MREALQGVPRFPSENANFAQAVVDRGNTAGSTPSPTRAGWKPGRSLRSATGTAADNRLFPFFPNPDSINPKMPVSARAMENDFVIFAFLPRTQPLALFSRYSLQIFEWQDHIWMAPWVHLLLKNGCVLECYTQRWKELLFCLVMYPFEVTVNWLPLCKLLLVIIKVLHLLKVAFGIFRWLVCLDQVIQVLAVHKFIHAIII